MTIGDAISLLDELGFRYEYGCSDCQTRADSLSAVIFSQSPEYSRGREISKSSIITFTGSLNPEVDEEKMNRSKSNQESFEKERDELKEKQKKEAKKDEDDNE
jgi:hypothetical protein